MVGRLFFALLGLKAYFQVRTVSLREGNFLKLNMEHLKIMMCSKGISFAIWSRIFQGEPIFSKEMRRYFLKFAKQLFATNCPTFLSKSQMIVKELHVPT